MNKINIKYVFDDDSVVEKYGLYNVKLHYIDLNSLISSECPCDIDYIKRIEIKISNDVK